MNTFVNGFHISKKNDNSEVVIYFTQVAPGFPENGFDLPTKDSMEVVGSFVMTNSCALELSKMLASLLDGSTEIAPVE